MNAAEQQIAAVIPEIFEDDPVPDVNGGADSLSIPEGQRDARLTSEAGRMRRRGFSPEAIAAALHVHNEQYCTPPLPGRDVERIARSVGRYAPQNAAAPIGTAVAAESISFISAADLCLAEPATPRWHVPGILAPGVILEIDGKLKSAGKTTFVAAMVKAVISGRTFLDRSTRQSRVVWLTEERAPTFKETLKRAGLDDTNDLSILPWHKVKGLAWPVVMQAAVKHAKAFGAEVLIVDTIGQFAGLRGDAENNSGDVLLAVEPLQLAAAENLAVGVTRHERKGGGEVGESGRGSSAFSAAMDIIVSIRRAEGQTKKTVRVLQTLSRFVETPENLVIELTDAGYIALGTKGTVAVMEAERTILDVLAESEADAKELKDIYGPHNLKRTIAQEALNNLTTAGIITCSGKGKKGSPYRWFRTVKDSAGTQINRCGSISDSSGAA